MVSTSRGLRVSLLGTFVTVFGYPGINYHAISLEIMHSKSISLQFITLMLLHLFLVHVSLLLLVMQVAAWLGRRLARPYQYKYMPTDNDYPLPRSLQCIMPDR